MNTVILIGRLTRDPELRYSKTGKAVCNFTLAVDRQFNKEETDFIPIVTWGKTAENSANYLDKGRLVAVEGRLQIRSYDDKDGNKRRIAEVVANNVQFLDWGKKKEKPKTESKPDFGDINLDDLPF